MSPEIICEGSTFAGYLDFICLTSKASRLYYAVLERWCWNWQTGMVEGHVPKGVEVQVLSSAQEVFQKENPHTGDF